MSSINVIRASETKASIAAQKVLCTAFHQFKDSPILFLSSGGSCLRILDNFPAQAIPAHLTISVLDERHTSDTTLHNLSALRQTSFYNRAKKQGAQTLAFLRPKISLSKAASAFATKFKGWKQQYTNGKIIITQGMGADGHTAGIFPYPEDPKRFNSLFLSEGWVTGYDAGDKNQYSERITVTCTFLHQEVSASVWYITGTDKQERVTQALESPTSLAAIPARVMHTMQGVTLVTSLNVTSHQYGLPAHLESPSGRKAYD